MLVTYENIELLVQENNQHEWLLETAQVAKGYNVTIDAILAHKNRKQSDFIEGKHFIGADNLSAPHVKQLKQIFWTKRGVVRLGFGINSEEARKFRDWAEDLIIIPIATPSRKELALWVIQQEEEIERLRIANVDKDKAIKSLAPKAELMERVLDSKKMIDIGQASKILSLAYGRNTLFKNLRENGVFFINRNEPKQEYIDRGFFKLKETFIERKEHPGFVVTKILVSQKGLEFIGKLFNVVTTKKQRTLIK
jgi:phage antirepressor YoqD-like protein